MAKRRFRKMYFLCENKKVISPNVRATNVYQYKEDADAVLSQKDKGVKMWDVDKIPKAYSVEGFYLVHESLFEELLNKP